MSWTDDLADSIENALAEGEPCEIKVQSDAAAEMGRQAAERMAPRFSPDPKWITFVVELPDPYAAL